MCGTFSNCYVLNEIQYLDNLNKTAVTAMAGILENCFSFCDLYLGNFNFINLFGNNDCSAVAITLAFMRIFFKSRQMHK